MSAFENNLILLTVIFIMLLGAFILGYFFGNYQPQQTQEPLIQTIPASQTSNKDNKTPINKVDEIKEGKLEIADIIEAGKVRAMKTRERAGVMSSDITSEVSSKNLDLIHLGKGNDQQPDDLKKIVGIGQSIEESLNGIGIYNYSQLAKMTDQDMRMISKVIDFFPGRIQRDDWKGQANKLMKG